jgi:hypothetical protein
MKGSLGPTALAARWTVLLMLPVLASCAQDVDGDVVAKSQCSPVGPSVGLPNALRETSGVAIGVKNPDWVWTHNDGRRPFLYAFDHNGQRQARVELNRTPRDWEDIARAPCDLGNCLYAADTGDNAERRDNISFYRLAEPEGTGEGTADVVRHRMALPDGPRDIEAMYSVLRHERPQSSGYRLPLSLVLRSEEVVTLEEVQRLTSDPPGLAQMVTGASATLDGSTVAIRTYQSLDFFDVSEGERLTRADEGRVNLRSLREAQGEGVGFGTDGEIVLSSEAALGFGPSFTFLTCVP